MPHLSHADTLAFIKAAQAGDRAAEARLAADNDGLVGHVAKAYFRPGGLEKDDLLQAGRIGLLEAIRRFDVSRPTRFSTYAVYRIRHSVQDAIGAHPLLPQAGAADKTRFNTMLTPWDCSHQSGDYAADVIADPRDAAAEADTAERVGFVLGCLTAQERRVVELRFGLGGGVPRTNDEAGAVLGVSGQRVQQIWESALRRMRTTRPLEAAAA